MAPSSHLVVRQPHLVEGVFYHRPSHGPVSIASLCVRGEAMEKRSRRWKKNVRDTNHDIVDFPIKNGDFPLLC